MIEKCMFPVAGYGTRFLPATKSMPKEMLPIVNKPLVQYGVEEAIEAGMTTCALVTGRGKVILAEFGYGGKIMESFPFDQAQERYSMYVLKAYGLPKMYWHGMLRGRM